MRRLSISFSQIAAAAAAVAAAAVAVAVAAAAVAVVVVVVVVGGGGGGEMEKCNFSFIYTQRLCQTALVWQHGNTPPLPKCWSRIPRGNTRVWWRCNNGWPIAKRVF